MIEKNNFKQFNILVRDITQTFCKNPIENIFIGVDINTSRQKEYNEDFECIGMAEYTIVKAKDIITGTVVNYGPHVFTDFGDFITQYRGFKYLLERGIYKDYTQTDLYSFKSSIDLINRIIKYAKAFLEAGDLFLINIDSCYQYSESEMTEEEKKEKTESILVGIREISEMDFLDNSFYNEEFTSSNEKAEE